MDEEIKTAEAWATELGHLPEFVTPPAPKGMPKKAMRAVYNRKAQLFLSTKAHHSWPVGKELTKAEYLEVRRSFHHPRVSVRS